MVFAIRFFDGTLIRVKNASKAIARAKHLLRKDRHLEQIPIFVRAESVVALRLGYGMTRVLVWKR